MYSNAVLSTPLANDPHYNDVRQKSTRSNIGQHQDSLSTTGTLATGVLTTIPTRMRKHPQQERSVQMVSAIRQAAVLAFRDRKAGHQTSMQEVALRAGASLGSVYQYYANMESLLAAIYEDVIVDWLRNSKTLSNLDSDHDCELFDRVLRLDLLFDASLGEEFYIPALKRCQAEKNLLKPFVDAMNPCVLAGGYSNTWLPVVQAN